MKETLADSRKLQAIIFDVGGVLLHPDGELMVNVLEPVIGYRLDPQICQDSFLLTDHRLVGRSVNEQEKIHIWAEMLQLPFQSAASAWKVLSQLDNGMPNLWGKIDPCTIEILSGLRAYGFTMGVLSNARGNVEKLLVALDLAGFFDDIIDSAVVGLEKPDPRAYLLAAQRLGTPISDCAYIGDSLDEIEAADRLNMYPVLYDRLDLYKNKHSFCVLQQLCLLPGLLKNKIFYDAPQ